MTTLPASPEALAARFASATPYEIIAYALRTFGTRAPVACSFGVEDMVVLHEAARIGGELGLAPRVFSLDTGRLPQETYDLLERARGRYGLTVETYAPDSAAVEDLVRRKGPNSFYVSVDDRKECCGVRKQNPLVRALRGAAAWITGLRREQSPTRSEVGVVELDSANGGIIKLNPLAHWTESQVWEFVRANDVPTHALHKRGYPSIGCAPCTRAVEPGEGVRAGRWWWEDAAHKECGLHTRRQP